MAVHREWAGLSGSAAVAYVSQTPFVLQASVRENILLQHPYVAARYAQVVEACGLAKDIGAMAAGDATVTHTILMIMSFALSRLQDDHLRSGQSSTVSSDLVSEDLRSGCAHRRSGRAVGISPAGSRCASPSPARRTPR